MGVRTLERQSMKKIKVPLNIIFLLNYSHEFVFLLSEYASFYTWLLKQIWHTANLVPHTDASLKVARHSAADW